MTSRAWTFTSYSTDINPDREKLKYLVYQREICPTTAREHWQGYFIALNAIRLKQAKRIVGCDSAHLETAKGTAQQNRTYCTKEESRKPNTEPIEFGTCPQGQGARYGREQVRVTCHKVAGNTKAATLCHCTLNNYTGRIYMQRSISSSPGVKYRTSSNSTQSKSSNTTKDSNSWPISTRAIAILPQHPRFSSIGGTQEQEKQERLSKRIQEHTSSQNLTKTETSGSTTTTEKKQSSSTNSTDGFHTTCSCACATVIRYKSPSREGSLSSKLRALFSRQTNHTRTGIRQSKTNQPGSAESVNSDK